MKLSEAAFARLVEKALEDIPDPFTAYMRDVAVDIEPVPDRQTCRVMGLDDPGDLLGLYTGTPMTDRSLEETGRMPDRITIYQRNIERGCRTREEIVRQVRKTVLHEIGHHFGLSEDDLEDLGYA